jgi:parvulin-like peptidyl-prolyl isomerase
MHSPVRRVLALLFAVSFLAAACSGDDSSGGGGAASSAAARVDGVAIPASKVTDDLQVLVAAIDAVPGDLLPPEQRIELKARYRASDTTYTPEARADVLTNLILKVVIDRGLEQFKIAVESQDTEAATTQVDNPNGSILHYASAAAKKDAVDTGARAARLFRYLEDRANVWFSDADVDAYYQLKKANFDQPTACTAHILVADEALATRLLGELRGGASFASLAAANSTDPSNKDAGGDLGCTAEGQFVPEFEAAVKQARDGDLIGPVKTQFGFHLIRVISTYKAPAYDAELKTQVRTQLATPRGWLDLTLSRTKIEVDSSFGTWSNDDIAVVPPAATAGSTTTTR